MEALGASREGLVAASEGLAVLEGCSIMGTSMEVPKEDGAMGSVRLLLPSCCACLLHCESPVYIAQLNTSETLTLHICGL